MHKSFTADPKGAVDVFLYTAAEFKLLENDPFPSARSIAEGQVDQTSRANLREGCVA